MTMLCFKIVCKYRCISCAIPACTSSHIRPTRLCSDARHPADSEDCLDDTSYKKERKNEKKHGSNPPYNYGLHGQGKKRRKPRFPSQSFKITGEILFGLHPVAMALEAKRRQCYQLFVKEYIHTDAVMAVVDKAASSAIPHHRVSGEVLDTMCGARPHQGVCMDVSKLPVATSIHITRDINGSDQPPVWLLPYMVQDPMNLGAILRSAYFLGIEKIILPKKNSCSLSAVVSKASAGALEVIDIATCRDNESLSVLLQDWKNVGGCVVGAVSPGKDSIPVHTYMANNPTLIIVGNEGTGLDESIVSQCDVLVSIHPPGSRTPLPGTVESLNVSVATGILLHSILQRQNSGSS